MTDEENAAVPHGFLYLVPSVLLLEYADHFPVPEEPRLKESEVEYLGRARRAFEAGRLDEAVYYLKLIRCPNHHTPLPTEFEELERQVYAAMAHEPPTTLLEGD